MSWGRLPGAIGGGSQGGFLTGLTWFHSSNRVVTGNPIALVYDANASPLGFLARQYTAAINDEFEIIIPLKAGTYELYCRGSKHPSRGILSVYVDGGFVVNWDMYDPTTNYFMADFTASINVPSDKEVKITGKAASKNPNSTGYYIILQYWEIRRQ